MHFVPSYDIVCVNVCKQSLISGGGQLLGNDDGVMIPMGFGLPACRYRNDKCKAGKGLMLGKTSTLVN